MSERFLAKFALALHGRHGADLPQFIGITTLFRENVSFKRV